MSKLPRGPASTAPTGTPGGSIRPPNSGLTLPRSLASNLHADIPTTPSLTQRMQTGGSRRATLTTATFMPLHSDGSATISRSSGIGGAAATRLLGNATTSPSASFVSSSEPHATFATRTPGLRGPPRLGPLSRTHARSPTVGPPGSCGSGEGNNWDISPPTLDSDCPVRQATEMPPVPRLGHVVSSANSSSSMQSNNKDGALRPGSVAGLRCGEPVLIPTQCVRGTLRYLGPIDGKQGAWAGIELDEIGKGKNDGSVAGKAYFSCQPNTGLFLAPSKVQPLSQKQKDAGSAAQAANVASLAGAHAGGGSNITPHSVLAPEHQRVQKKNTSRSRIGSEAYSTIGASHTPGSRSITSPMLNRRKTLSRATPVTANTPVPEVPPGSSITRLPPATISRGASRTRPISTTGSIVSNRTSSPLSSRPSSRLLVPDSNTDPSLVTMSPPKPTAFTRTKPFGNTPAADQRQFRRNTGMHRSAATPSGRLAEQPNGKGTGALPRSRTGAPADSADRLRLRVDMLEAENRVLRLKNEQDKAHLAAGQMLARDLAIVNGSTPPQSHSFLGSSSVQGGSDVSLTGQQLKEVQDTLERERVAAKEAIENLENEIRSLKLGSTREDIPSRSSNSNGESKQNTAVVDTKDASVVFNSLPDSSELDSRISEMQSVLKQTKESHAKDILASKTAYSQLYQTLEEKISTIESMEAQLSRKTEEASTLNTRIGRITAELEKTSQLYQDLLKREEIDGNDQGNDGKDAVVSLTGQIERLQLEIASNKDAKVELVAELDDTKQTLSVTKDQLSRAQSSLEDMEKKSLDYDSIHAFVTEYHSNIYSLASLLGQRTDDKHGISVKQALDGIPAEFDQEVVSLETASTIFSSVRNYLIQLSKRADSASNQLESMVDEAQSKDARISTLEMELSDMKRQPAQSPSETLADSDDHSSVSQLHYLQSRVEELEGMNDELMEQCDSLIEERAMFNEHLKMLEAESNRLVDDIDQLTVQNQKLAEELRVTSMQNSTVSLDMAALDSRLTGEPHTASSDAFGSAEPTTTNLGAASADRNSDKDDIGDIDGLRNKYEREISVFQSRLADLEQRKNGEIKKLQDEVMTMENLVEDKVFNEFELTNKISNLTDQIDRLQREIQRSSSPGLMTNGSSAAQTNSGSIAEKGNTVEVPPTEAGTGDGNSSGSGSAHEVIKSAVESIDDESLYCDICESSGHAISDCPQMAAPTSIFKQEVSIDSSRPYCDNCEAFEGHWTEDCPHGDEMF